MYILPNILFDDLPLGLEVFFSKTCDNTVGFTSVKDMPGINSLMPNPYKVDIGISAHGPSSDIFTSYDM